MNMCEIPKKQRSKLANSRLGKCSCCSSIGTLNDFYSPRFCSVSCATRRKLKQLNKSPTHHDKQNVLKNALRIVHQLKTGKVILTDGGVHKTGQTRNPVKPIDWKIYISRDYVKAAPVFCFHHCPMHAFFGNNLLSMIVEIANKDRYDHRKRDQRHFFASIVKVTGYRVKLRFIGCNDSSYDTWHNLCASSIYPVGWAAANRILVSPPYRMLKSHDDWPGFIKKTLINSSALPMNFPLAVKSCLNQCPLRREMKVEVVDRVCLGRMRVATVEDIIGDRLKLRYTESSVENDYFYCHYLSSLLHHVGWSQLVGHKIEASHQYKALSLSQAVFRQYAEDDCTPQMLPTMPAAPELWSPSLHGFSVGMKLEAVDPLSLSNICVATVHEVLNYGYLMISIDKFSEDGTTDEELQNSNLFCRHKFSPYIRPVGFCEQHGLKLTGPAYKKDVKPRDLKTSTKFSWSQYLDETSSVAAPLELFHSEVPHHGFEVGMKLEAVDLMEPHLICVASVSRIAGRLLLIHFDGWDASYDQWMDCQSPDIYPVGWCELVGHPIQGPNIISGADERTGKKKPKTKKFTGKRRRSRQHVHLKALNTSTSSSQSIYAEPLERTNIVASSSVNVELDMRKSSFKNCDILQARLPHSESDLRNDSVGCTIAADTSMNSSVNSSINSSSEEMPILSPADRKENTSYQPDVNDSSLDYSPDILVPFTL